MSDEAAFLIIAPYAGHWEIEEYPTSRVIRANCGHLGWLSPQGESHALTDYTVCSDCASEVIENPDPKQQRIAVAGAVEAIGALHGEAEAEGVRKLMRKWGIIEEER